MDAKNEKNIEKDKKYYSSCSDFLSAMPKWRIFRF